MDLSSLSTSLPPILPRPLPPPGQSIIQGSHHASWTDPMEASVLDPSSKGLQVLDSRESASSLKVYMAVDDQDQRLRDLPIEIFEQILGFVFLRSSFATPSSSLTSIPTHLLLVSHSFRQLALPFFYNSIAITRPSDFVTFFHPQDGLFVVGEEAEKRWNYVQEVVMRKDVYPPVLRSPLDFDIFLVPLVLPTRRRIQHLCILDDVSPPSSWLAQEGVKELLLQIQSQPELRRAASDQLRGFYEDAAEHHPDGTLLTFLEWLDDPTLETEEDAMEAFISRLIASQTKSQLEDEQQQFFDSFVIATSPRILRDRWPPTLDLSMRSFPGSESPFQVDTYAQHFNEKDSPTKAFLNQAMERIGDITTVAHVHLVEYPQDVREKFIAWIRRRGVPATTVSISRWSWQLEDGTVEELNMEDLSTTTPSGVSTWLV